MQKKNQLIWSKKERKIDVKKSPCLRNFKWKLCPHLCSEAGPLFVDFLLLRVDGIGRLGMGLHEPVCRLVQLTDLVSEGCQVSLQAWRRQGNKCGISQ